VTAKISAARKRAFLRAIARSGNLTLAAEQAGVSKSWAVKARLADPGFALDCRAAKASFDRLRMSGEGPGARGSNRPPKGWRQSGGKELRVCGRGSQRVQIVRASEGQWTPRAEARFLGALTRTNNLEMACDQAGMTLSSYEAHSRRWPDFRRRVREARAFASERLEAALEADSALPLDLDFEAVDDLPLPGIAEALAIVRRHRRR
jgi:hypothetical protein